MPLKNDQYNFFIKCIVLFLFNKYLIYKKKYTFIRYDKPLMFEQFNLMLMKLFKHQENK